VTTPKSNHIRKRLDPTPFENQSRQYVSHITKFNSSGVADSNRPNSKEKKEFLVNKSEVNSLASKSVFHSKLQDGEK
jgi:hypothetical protein